MRQRGFTLIELLITIAIIGILAGVAVTAYVGVVTKSARQEAYTNLGSLYLLEDRYFDENGDYTPARGVCAQDNPGNIDLIRVDLPDFRPGPGASLQYSYCIEHDTALDGTTQVPCYRASAYGNSNSRVEGDTFMIDCNNNRDF